LAISFPSKPSIKPSKTLSPLIQKKTPYNTMLEVLLSYDPVILQSEEEGPRREHMLLKNQAIIDYLLAKYPERHAEELDVNDSTIAMLGMIVAMAEENEYREATEEDFARMASEENPLGCLITAVDALLDVSTIVAIYTEWKKGATAGTVVRAFRTVLRRVAWAWTVFSVVYQVGNCLDFW
jgi:hypothetical protein